MSNTFAEQYRALQRRNNVNMEKLCELQVRLENLEKMKDDPALWKSSRSIEILERQWDKCAADFSSWKEEYDQIECDIVCLSRENNQKHLESQIADLKKYIAENEKKN